MKRFSKPNPFLSEKEEELLKTIDPKLLRIEEKTIDPRLLMKKPEKAAEPRHTLRAYYARARGEYKRGGG